MSLVIVLLLMLGAWTWGAAYATLGPTSRPFYWTVTAAAALFVVAFAFVR